MGKIIITVVDGHEPRCPRCGNENAMLGHGYYDGVSTYKCRDCGYTVTSEECELVSVGSIANRIAWDRLNGRS